MTRSIIVSYLMFGGALLATPPQFTESLISGDLKYPYGIGVGDLDGDGDLDVTVADCRNVNSVFWFENDGAGKFTRHLAYHQPPPAWRIERHVIVDVNRDGFPDIVIVENSTSDLRWLENPGPKRVREPWETHFIALSGRVPGAGDVAAGDIDGDGWPDVVASCLQFNTPLIWYKNPGPLVGRRVDYNAPIEISNSVLESTWAWGRRYSIGENLLETRTVRFADLNGDGKLDLLATATVRGLVLWFENPGRATTLPWTQHTIDKSGRPSHGQAIDMDGDGDADVVMANGMLAGEVPSEVLPVVPQVVWYENLGKGAAWKKHVIKSPFPQAFEAVAADLDGDGDMDVVATAYRKGPEVVALAWFENTGNDTWVMHPLKASWPGAVQVIVADLDGDGRPDIVASAEDGSSELRWWRNSGPAR